MPIGIPLMIAGILMVGPLPPPAQNPTTVLATQPVRFESWKPVAVPGEVYNGSRVQPVAVAHRRGRNALIGGAIGTVAGLAFCTVVSNLVNDPGTGFSTCTVKGYLLTGGVGFALGFVIGLSV